MQSSTAFDRWVEHYAKLASQGWPSETLIRLFKGPYVPELDRSFAGKKVLDIGFGEGNNAIFLSSLGLNVSGTEVSRTLCDSVAQKLARLGCRADLRVGTNRQLPFDTDTFDFLVSWNVIHYENQEEHMRQAIAEYARVLKPGGRLFLSTTGPEHKILRDSRALGNHRYEIGRADDFRKGEVFFYFDAPNYIQQYFSSSFRDIRIGRTHDHLLTETLDWFIVSAVK